MKIISPFILPPNLRQRCVQMENDPNLYLETKNADIWATSDSLLLSRARPNGILNAMSRMREAADGVREKREPISVLQAGEYYLVVDGNSTAVILLAIGVQLFPVKIIGQ